MGDRATDGTDGTTPAIEIRRARASDVDDVVAFTSDSWPDREGVRDYLPDVIADWIDADDDSRRTLVAETDGTVVGVVQALLLSADEAWLQGMRTHPDHRGRGVATALTDAALAWAREAGAVVARDMVFSWNGTGLGLSRATGFEPATEFRWVHPEPDPEAGSALPVTTDVGAAWQYWTRSDARDHLAGLAIASEATWAVRELTRERLAEAAADDGLLVVGDATTRGVAFRSGVVERPGADDRLADYGVAAWADADACRALLGAIARDAATVAADRTRVLIPETVRAVSDASAARCSIADDPDFVLAADLTRY